MESDVFYSLSVSVSLFRARAAFSCLGLHLHFCRRCDSMLLKLPSLVAYQLRFLILILLVFLLLFLIREGFSFRRLIITIVCFETRMARWMTNESLQMPLSIVVSFVLTALIVCVLCCCWCFSFCFCLLVCLFFSRSVCLFSSYNQSGTTLGTSAIGLVMSRCHHANVSFP